MRGKGGNRVLNSRDVLLPHRSEPDRVGRDFDGMAVLDPKQHSFPAGRSGQAGISVGRPGVGIMRARQCTAAATLRRVDVAENVQRVFDDVVPGGAYDMEKKLPTKLGQSKSLAYIAAVEDDGPCAGRAALVPFSQHPAASGEQRRPEADRAGAAP